MGKTIPTDFYMDSSEFAKYACNQHDVECNQKYADVYPYSLHLTAVEAQVRKFIHLIGPDDRPTVIKAAWGHDLIEDARVTYSDLVPKVGKDVVDVIYAVTDLRGRNRDERHGAEYIHMLRQNPLAIYVKLCDIAANTLFSKLMNSYQYERYTKEFPKLKEQIYLEKFNELYQYIESL